MSHPNAIESQSKQLDKAHESGHQAAMSHIAAQAYHPSESNQARQTKSEPNAIDFNKAGDIYASKSMAQASSVDSRAQGGAHTVTDSSPSNTMSASKPADNAPADTTGKPNPELTKIHPEVAPNIYDFSNKKPQGETKPASGAQPDISNNAAADGKKQNSDAAAAGQYDKSRENGRKEFNTKPAAGAAKPNSDDSEPAVPINEGGSAADSKRADTKPATDKPADKPSSSWMDSLHKLEDLWGSEITNLISPRI